MKFRSGVAKPWFSLQRIRWLSCLAGVEYPSGRQTK